MSLFDLLIFDLDGTLVDSKRDLVSSVNLMLKEFSLSGLEEKEVVSFIGKGMSNLIQRSLHAAGGDGVAFDDALARFQSIYSEHLLDTTILYDGVQNTLDTLRDVKKVVLTNKPYHFSLKILEGLNIRHHFDLIIGGDTLPILKPSSDPINYILDKMNVNRQRSLIIGDSGNDILSGKAANIITCGVLYGFTSRANMKKLEADYYINKFSELINIV